MASQAMYCLSVQIGSREDDLTTNDIDSKTMTDKSACETFPMSTGNKESTTTISQTHPNNIILLRGARSDNGHIILHNNQDLMSLIGDEEKHVLIQHQRLKGKKANEGAIVLQQQPNAPSKSSDNETIVLQAANLKKNPTASHLSEGQFLIQHRVGARGLSDGPILLQTLKRLEKSQSIFLFRNNSTALTSSVRISSKKSSTNTSANSLKVSQMKQHKPQKEPTADEEKNGKLEQVNQKHLPLGNDGEPIKLPENLESLPRADHFPTQRHRWNTNEEIAAILINFERHSEWQSKEVKTRPKSGSMLLYSRKKVRYRRDGYCWKKRKDGKTTREDHMKLKVQGTECIYGCYVHSAILPTFHRRCYWLLQNPDIVLVHYLNVPYPDDNKMAVIAPSLALWGDKKEWTKEELVSQLKPMFFSEDEPDTSNDIELSTAETVESIVVQLMEKQRSARQAALVKQLECGCANSTCTDGKSCSHPMRRITVVKNANEKRLDNCNQWNERWKGHGGQIGGEIDTTSKCLNNPIHYQVRDGQVSSSSLAMGVANGSNHHTMKSKSNSNSNIVRNSALHESPNINELPINTCNNSNSINNRQVSIVSQSNDTALNTAGMSIMAANIQRQQHQDPTRQHLQMDNQEQANLVNAARMNVNTSTATPPLVLNLSQIQNPNGSLLILNGQQQPLVCQTQYMKGKVDKEQQQQQVKSEMVCQKLQSNLLTPKEEVNGGSGGGIVKQHQSMGNGRCNSVGEKSDSKSSENTSKDSNDSLSYFNETLDLSQEDIQKTLSANMPLSNHNTDETMNSDINPMDFMDNVCVGNPPSVHDDDVFVNLDAFDMLVEFPDLELDGGGTKHNLSDATIDAASINCDKLVATDAHNGKNSNSAAELFDITDYSPEWAYPDGGVKILITGPWDVNCSYTVLFDSFPVPTTIVQSGVLRCYCPAHDVGLVTLQVACEGFVISNSVIFEYKSQPKVDVLCEGTYEDFCKFNLLHRLEALDTKMHIRNNLKELPDDSVLLKQPNFEERLVNYCQTLSGRTWNENLFGWNIGHKNMTLLHLASALGYTKLVLAMLTWREENSSIILEAEIDALRQDDDGFTPLMWACAGGHNDTAIMLYHWNHNAINLKNRFQMSAVDLAKSNGYTNLTTILERLENERANGKLANASVKNLKNSNLLVNTSTNNLFAHTYANPPNGGFKLEFGEKVCGGNKGSASPGMVDVKKGTNYEQLNDFGAENNAKNELEKGGNENRSHDGVFLRPVAISSSSSPILKFAKRPSVDSGIGIDLKGSFRSFGKCVREAQKPLSSRLDRSMSLPIASLPQSYGSLDVPENSSLSIETSMEGSNVGLSSHNLLSPLRKMDFALCEISAGDSSPMGQQDTVQNDDENDERHLDNDSMSQEGGVVGESDAKVLTLAEQIIAAIPERIKNESDEMMSIGSPLSESLSVETPSMGVLGENLMDPLLDSLPNSHYDQEYNFEFSDHNYRYHDVGTPCSSLSPASSGPLQSPASYSIPPDPLVNTPSPPPTTQDFTEFLQASNTTPKPFEADFSNLTLTDSEQRELYEAAKCIQKAYRSYKGRKKLEEQDKERTAAIVIQNYYRRYKQYVYYRQMTHAALIIQNGYRSYCENKRFKKAAQHQQGATNCDNVSSSQCLENFYKNYQTEQAQFQNSATPKELSPSGPLKRTYSQRTQNQAARKIQQFMRQSKMNIWEDHFSYLTSERTSRKREACPPTQGGGLPPKLAVSRSTRPSIQRAKIIGSLEVKMQSSN
ncbi:calmodulin-binding transcription activator 1 isoform X3 [Lutzomyia longipalpis]|uniref:calmodulin-binding transcription activator 1 isoform X3 n=1 Tax=Lutzomyia longipalpis TaxID=7200 RepID=UPI00248464A7|nr:calmodulin-binding transcription activator 1 isoform X3 [Lutzomyia longipalpis]